MLWLVQKALENSGTKRIHVFKFCEPRVQMMGELLKHIRTIKMYTWEQIFTSRILQIRNRELKQLSVCKLFLEAFRVAQNVIHLLREHLGPYHCCLEYKRPNFLSLIMNCVMRSDQKVHGCILCLLLGSIDGDLHHLHIWSLCGHRTYFRRRNGTLEKNLLTKKNQVDLYFISPRLMYIFLLSSQILVSQLFQRLIPCTEC